MAGIKKRRKSTALGSPIRETPNPQTGAGYPKTLSVYTATFHRGDSDVLEHQIDGYNIT